MEAIELARKIASILDAKKAKDIQVIGITDISSIADYFVIAGGTSNTQVKALADEIDFKLSQENTVPLRSEGIATGNWVVLDYGSVIVHVFHSSAREFYKLERIWADGERVDISDILTPDAADF